MSKAASFVLLGVLVGVLILGILGRAATAAVALIGGHSHNVSFRGIVDSILVGGVVGAIGGVFLWVFRRLVPLRPPIDGLITGAVLFGLSLLLYGTRSSQAATGLSVTLIVVAVCYLLYGVVLDAWVGGARRGKPAESAAPTDRIVSP